MPLPEPFEAHQVVELDLEVADEDPRGVEFQLGLATLVDRLALATHQPLDGFFQSSLEQLHVVLDGETEQLVSVGLNRWLHGGLYMYWLLVVWLLAIDNRQQARLWSDREALGALVVAEEERDRRS